MYNKKQKQLMLLLTLLALLLALLTLTKCVNDIGCLKGYKFANNIKITTFEDCFEWTWENIDYTPDAKDYAQSPEETYHRGKGDCEDQTLMTQNLLYTYMGINSYTVLVKGIEKDPSVTL